MKKILVVLFLTTLFSQISTAQRVFNIGLKAGTNFDSPIFSGSSDIQTLKDGFWGFHTGLSMRFRFSFVSIQPEINYAFSKTDVGIQDPLVTETASGNFNSFTIPVMVNFHFLKVLHAGLGPYYTFMNPKFKGINPNWEQLENNFKSGSYGLQFGGGFDFGRVVIDANYQIGLSKYQSDFQLNGNNYTLDSRTNTLWLSIGIWFLKPKKNN